MVYKSYCLGVRICNLVMNDITFLIVAVRRTFYRCKISFSPPCRGQPPLAAHHFS